MKKQKSLKRGKLSVSIVIPAKNEEKTIKEIINKCRPYGDEILVVDGHSQDKTREFAESLGIKVILDNGKGKGDALRCAIKKVKEDIIVFIDADGSHDPNDIPKLIKPIIRGEAEHVTGSRKLGGSEELHGDINKFLRVLASDIIILGINYRFGVKLSDSQNGFRAIKTSLARKLNLKENITTIEQEMIIKTLRAGYRMAEVPAHEYKRKYGESVIKLRKVGFRYLYSFLKYLFFD